MNLINLLKQYKVEKKKWEEAGKPFRTEEEMSIIYEICSSCPKFKPGGGMLPGYDKCEECGCNLHPSNLELNKLAWKTTNCPDDPPKW